MNYDEFCKTTDLIWSVIMSYPIWDRKRDKSLSTDLKGFNMLNRVYARIVESFDFESMMVQREVSIKEI